MMIGTAWLAVSVLCCSLLTPLGATAAVDSDGVAPSALLSDVGGDAVSEAISAESDAGLHDEIGEADTEGETDTEGDAEAEGDDAVSNLRNADDMLDPLTLEPLELLDPDDDAATGETAGGDTVATAPQPQAAAGYATSVGTEHMIDVAIVTPTGKVAPTLTDAEVSALIAKASTYWSAQSGGQISSIRQGTATLRYTTPYACSEPGYLMPDAASRFGNSDTVYNERNGRHLLVIVPKGCGSEGQAGVGLGDLVVSPANGGVIWMQNLPWGLDIFAHEFGHNLGLRHANTHECPNAADGTPVFEGTPGAVSGNFTPSFSDGCVAEEYGDRVDVMGNISVINGQVNAAPSTLSVTNALSLGVMPVEAVERIALEGASTVTRSVSLKSVSSTGAGTRGVVVTDPISGTEYVFEHRDGSGQDAQSLFGKGKLADYGVGFGVRMMTNRLGASSEVFTALDSSVYYGRRQYFRAGETLVSRTGGVQMRITSIAASTATLEITLRSTPTNPAPVGSSVPTIDGEFTPGETLSVRPGIWSTTTLDYQWLANGSPIAGATAATLLLGPDQSGAAITVRITGSKPGFVSVSRTSEPSIKVAGATPKIAGTAALGSTLVAETPGWAPGTTFDYQWYAGAAAIPGATEAAFAVTPLQIGRPIAVEVTGTQAGYALVTRMSGETSVVPAGTLRYQFSPQPGETLSWPDANLYSAPACCRLSYRWLADGIAISGATQPTYTVASVLPAGGTFSLEVAVRSAGVPGGVSDLKASIGGVAVVGSTLNAVSEGVDLGDLTIQWLANGVALKGATQAALIVPAGAAAKRLTVQLTWVAASLKVTSAATLRVSKAVTPSVAGPMVVGAVVTAKPGIWTTGMVLRYQWAANGSPIAGATKATYKVPATLLGQTLTVAVTGSKVGYATVALTSAATTAILLPLVAKKPVIVGVVKVNRQLTAKVAAWGPADVALTYQWFAAGKRVDGATEATFTPTGTRLGQRITVAVTGTKDGYRSSTLTSAATARVAR
ncbi:hypothetical protein GCM10022381_24990 [Leifsonia kafniensis]|uniref:Peptidase M11 gametolysin domain-containing protein n=2 Tax=Leifsonia kafniensis TaxID=475957 RepID=A0ABP7KMD2_9MICO